MPVFMKNMGFRSWEMLFLCSEETIQRARWIGKSTIVSAFAENEYKSYILIDFSVDSRKHTDINVIRMYNGTIN